VRPVYVIWKLEPQTKQLPLTNFAFLQLLSSKYTCCLVASLQIRRHHCPMSTIKIQLYSFSLVRCIHLFCSLFPNRYPDESYNGQCCCSGACYCTHSSYYRNWSIDPGLFGNSRWLSHVPVECHGQKGHDYVGDGANSASKLSTLDLNYVWPETALPKMVGF
jgi:hypothetical protein